jgi:hypothetical protein
MRAYLRMKANDRQAQAMLRFVHRQWHEAMLVVAASWIGLICLALFALFRSEYGEAAMLVLAAWLCGRVGVCALRCSKLFSAEAARREAREDPEDNSDD